MIVSVVGPGEKVLAPITVASTRFVQFRPSTMSRDVGVAEPLVDRTDSDPSHITHAALRFAVAAI